MIAAARPRWVMTTGWADFRTRASTAAASWRRSVTGTMSGIFGIRLTVRQQASELNPSESRPCRPTRSEEHTSELQSPDHLVCRLLLEKKKKQNMKAKHIR